MRLSRISTITDWNRLEADVVIARGFTAHHLKPQKHSVYRLKSTDTM